MANASDQLAILQGTLHIYVAFDWFMALPWPPTLLGLFFPALKFIPSV